MTKQFVVDLVESEDGSYPGLSIEQDDYLSYFENAYGEQLIFVYRKGSNKGTLYHSDYDWEAVEIIDGNTPEMVTDQHELMWLNACWWAATGEKAASQILR